MGKPMSPERREEIRALLARTGALSAAAREPYAGALRLIACDLLAEVDRLRSELERREGLLWARVTYHERCATEADDAGYDLGFQTEIAAASALRGLANEWLPAQIPEPPKE